MQTVRPKKFAKTIQLLEVIKHNQWDVCT